MGDARLGDIEADLDHGLFELVSVFGGVDGFSVGADQLDVVSFENSSLIEVHREVERCLAAEGREQRIGLLFGDDRLENRNG